MDQNMRIGFWAGLIPLTLIGGISSAAASGAVWCNVDDESVRFAVRSGVSRGISGGFLNFTADLTIKLAGVPGDFQNSRFARSLYRRANSGATTRSGCLLNPKTIRRVAIGGRADRSRARASKPRQPATFPERGTASSEAERCAAEIRRR